MFVYILSVLRTFFSANGKVHGKFAGCVPY